MRYLRLACRAQSTTVFGRVDFRTSEFDFDESLSFVKSSFSLMMAVDVDDVVVVSGNRCRWRWPTARRSSRAPRSSASPRFAIRRSRFRLDAIAFWVAKLLLFVCKTTNTVALGAAAHQSGHAVTRGAINDRFQTCVVETKAMFFCRLCRLLISCQLCLRLSGSERNAVR